MKIMHVTKKYPHALGGDAVVVSSLQQQQEAAGHTVVIVTSNCDEIVNADNIYKFGLKDTASRLDNITAKRVISLLALFVKAFAIIRKEKPDIIHTHSIDMAFFVSFAAHMYRIPMIHTFHIVTFYDAAQSVLRRKSELWLAKKAKLQMVTAPNTYDVKKLQAAGLEQAVVLPNGVDLALWKTQRKTMKNEKVTFVAIGRLENQKGYEYLIKAVGLVAKVQQLHVVIVGEGSQKTALRELARSLHVDDSVSFVGRKSPEEIRELLAMAHAAVFPSLYETTPLTLLEAWAASTPVIATPVGILRDIPTDFDAALVVPLRNEYALAAAMQQYAKSAPLRKVKADAGYKEAKKYTWPLIGQMAETIYLSAK